MALEPFHTAHSSDTPLVMQLSVFIDDRVGQLLRMTRLFDRTDIHILGLMVVNLTDSAVVRLIVDEPDEAVDLLQSNRFAVMQNDVLVVCVPEGKRALNRLWSAVLSAEINVHYTYALLGLSHGRPYIAIQAENLAMAHESLTEKGFVVLSQGDLLSGREE